MDPLSVSIEKLCTLLYYTDANKLAYLDLIEFSQRSK